MPGGLLIVNSSMIVNQPDRDDITLVMLPATTAATELGEGKVTNMIMMGALLAHTPLVAVETMRDVLIEKLGERKAHLVEANMRALEKGRELGLAALESA